MDYYEELGLSRSASTEEIRTVYKTLVRLLHPDAQMDETARTLADQQLKRVNGIMEILLNPPRRRRYDLSLSMPPAPPFGFGPVGFTPPPAPVHRLTPRSALLLLGAGVIIGISAEYFVSTAVGDVQVATARSAPPPGSEPQVQKAMSVPQSPELAPPPATPTPFHVYSPEAPIQRREPAERNAAYSIPRTQPRSSAGLRAMVTPAPFSAPPDLSKPIPTPNMPPTPAQRLQANLVDGTAHEAELIAGEWLYTPQVDAPAARLYAPEFIELYSHVDGGYVTGRFKSRYYVTNQPLSPDVNFSFRGPLSAVGSTALWEGPDGSRGTINLRVLPSGVLQVDWIRTKAGTERTLAYGKAILVKAATP